MSLYTHCGVTGAVVEGVTWLADPPLGTDNPPPGWGNPFTAGSWQRTGDEGATFTSDGGLTAAFVRAAPGTTLTPCR